MNRPIFPSLALLTVLFSGLGIAQPTITSIVDPHSGSTKLAPGGQALITGTNLGLNPTVTVGGINAFNLVPPQFGSTMTIQIPVNVAVGASVPVVVTAFGSSSVAFNISLTQYAPVLISATSGSLTSPRHGNGVGVTATTPAVAGETITFYAIGLGPTNPAVNTGVLAANNTTGTTTIPTVTFGANTPVNATVSRLANTQGFFGASGPTGLAGSSIALIGVYGVSAVVPAGTAAGTYPVSISIGGAISNTVNVVVGPAPTAPVISAIVGQSGKTALNPGSVAILSGLNLGTNPTVSVGGKTAFNITVNNGNQITIQIPVDAPLGTVDVTLANGGQTSGAFPIRLTQYAPALFPGNGQPLSAFHSKTNQPVTQGTPAFPGEQLYLLAYGLGSTTPVVPTGSLGPGNPPAFTTAVPAVSVGGSQATNVSASLSSGGNNSVGVYVVQFTLPTTSTTGNFASFISIGGASTGLVSIQVFTGPIITSVKNAASNISAGLPNSGIAQGSIFIAQGVNLGPAAISIAPNAFQTTSLSGTSISVTVAGTTVAPTLYYTSATQVAALLPSNTPLGNGTITITYNNQVGSTAPITVVQNNVGIFTTTSDGQGAGIVTYPDYSLVSPMKATNCGGVYTTCGAANPGDTLTVWTTGLGPVSGNETGGAGLGVDMANVDAKLWLGGILARIVFKGRGCCVGEDQIAFVVPDNVPTGCAVPLAIQVGNLVSNYAVIAIAPKGSRTCTPSNTSFNSSFVPGLTTSTVPIKIGLIQLANEPRFNAQGQFTGNVDGGFAFFASFNVPAAIQPFMASYLDDSPSGTCIVYNTSNFPDATEMFTNFTPIDGGASIKVTGPNGNQTIPLSVEDGAQFGPGTFVTPGTYTFTGTGGTKVGAVNAQLTVPPLATLTGLASGANLTVNRANGVTLNWTGGSPSSVVRIVGELFADNSAGASFRCYAAANAGTFTIPPPVTLSLPAGNYGWDFKNYTYGQFTATGLDLGLLQASFDTPVSAAIQ